MRVCVCVCVCERERWKDNLLEPLNFWPNFISSIGLTKISYGMVIKTYMHGNSEMEFNNLGIYEDEGESESEECGVNREEDVPTTNGPVAVRVNGWEDAFCQGEDVVSGWEDAVYRNEDKELETKEEAPKERLQDSKTMAKSKSFSDCAVEPKHTRKPSPRSKTPPKRRTRNREVRTTDGLTQMNTAVVRQQAILKEARSELQSPRPTRGVSDSLTPSIKQNHGENIHQLQQRLPVTLKPVALPLRLGSLNTPQNGAMGRATPQSFIEEMRNIDSKALLTEKTHSQEDVVRQLLEQEFNHVNFQPAVHTTVVGPNKSAKDSRFEQQTKGKMYTFKSF